MVFVPRSLAKMKYMQYVMICAKGALALLLVCLMTAMAYLHFNKADFSRRVLRAINTQLQTSIHSDRFSLDVLTHFPYVTARMRDVSVAGLDDSHLLDADEVHILLHPWHMLKGKLEVSQLHIEDGRIDVHVLPDRTLSLNIFAPSDDTGENQGLVLDFRQITLQNVALNFRDAQAGQDYALTFDKLRLRGRMGYQQLQLDLDGDFTSHRVGIGDLTFLNACKGKLDGTLNLDLNRQMYNFDALSLMLNGERFEINGSLRGDQAYTYVDLVVGHPTGDLARLSKILPPSFAEVISATGLSGRFGASGYIRGRMSADENPYVRFDLQMPSGHVTIDSQTQIPIVIQGEFTNGGMRQMSSSELDLQSIEGQWEGHTFSGMVRLIDIRDPAIQILFNGALPASAIAQYIPGLEVTNGTVFFEEVASARMWLNDLHFTDLRKIQANARLEQVAFAYREKTGHIAHAALQFKDGALAIDSLDMKWQRSSGRVRGTVSTLPDALQAGDAGLLTYDLNLDMDAVYIDDLREVKADPTQVRPVAIRGYAPLRLPAGKATITSDRFHMDRVAITDLNADVTTTLHEVEFSGSYKGMEGAVKGEGTLTIDEEGYLLNTKVTGRDINVKQCFWQFRDFGQRTISAEHLNGHLDAILLAQVRWDPEGRVRRDAIEMQAGLSITEGELIGFELLDKFSSYIHAEDLRHIRFERLDNYIEVRRGHVYLPVMFIQSNAANLAVSGVHDFDNNILYNVKINAGQVLSQKMTVHDPTLAPVPARKEGTFNLFYTIEGNVADFNYQSNKRGVASSFDQSEALRTAIRDKLMRYFEGTRELIEPPEWESIPEYEEALMPEEYLDPIHSRDF